MQAIHPTTDDLEAGLDHVRSSPRDTGRLEMIVARPREDERVVLAEGVLDETVGLAGDSWQDRPSSRTGDGTAHPDMQLNLMSSRVLDLVTGGDRERWRLAGDQLIVDLDLSTEALPPGTRLSIGDATIEVTEIPHRGCAKFTRRFGLDAHRFVNSEVGRELCLRGINAKVVGGGTIRPGDTITRV